MLEALLLAASAATVATPAPAPAQSLLPSAELLEFLADWPDEPLPGAADKPMAPAAGDKNDEAKPIRK